MEDSLNMDCAPEGSKHAFMHRFGNGRMRKNRFHQLRLGCFQCTTDGEAVDHFGHLRADHVCAQQLASLGIKYRLDEAFWLAERDSLAIADEGKVPILTS